MLLSSVEDFDKLLQRMDTMEMKICRLKVTEEVNSGYENIPDDYMQGPRTWC